MEGSYRIRNTATGLVLNRWGDVRKKPVKGNAVTLYEDTGSGDQRFAMVRLGDHVYFRLESAPELVLNRHSATGALMLWPLAEANEGDMLFDTRTTEEGKRLVMPAHGLYVTAPELKSGGVVGTEGDREYNGTQYFELEPVRALDGEAAEADKAGCLDVPFVDQRQYGGTFCLAACVLGIYQYFGFGYSMADLVKRGYVRAHDGYVNSTGTGFGWTRGFYGAAEEEYCAAISRHIKKGVPVVLEMKGADTHYVTCISGGETPAEIWVNDPMVGRTTLEAAYRRRGQDYQHLRFVEKAA